SGNSCGRTGYRTEFSNPSTTLSITAATPGTRSSISRGKSCPSPAAIGQPQVTQSEDWYEWSGWNVSLRLAVAPAWPAEPVGVAQPARRRMRTRTPLMLVACIRLRRGAAHLGEPFGQRVRDCRLCYVVIDNDHFCWDEHSLQPTANEFCMDELPNPAIHDGPVVAPVIPLVPLVLGHFQQQWRHVNTMSKTLTDEVDHSLPRLGQVAKMVEIRIRRKDQ